MPWFFCMVIRLLRIPIFAFLFRSRRFISKRRKGPFFVCFLFSCLFLFVLFLFCFLVLCSSPSCSSSSCSSSSFPSPFPLPSSSPTVWYHRLRFFDAGKKEKKTNCRIKKKKKVSLAPLCKAGLRLEAVNFKNVNFFFFFFFFFFLRIKEGERRKKKNKNKTTPTHSHVSFPKKVQ